MMTAFLIAISPVLISLTFLFWQDKAERNRIDAMFAEPPTQRTMMSLHGNQYKF